MKILITTDWYEPVINGVVTSVVNLSNELKKRGHEVKILTLSRSHHTYAEGDVIYAASIGAGKIYPEARLKMPVIKAVIDKLIEWKPDVIHSQCEFSTFFMAKKIADETNAPIVHGIRGLHSLLFAKCSVGTQSCAETYQDVIIEGRCYDSTKQEDRGCA